MCAGHVTSLGYGVYLRGIRDASYKLANAVDEVYRTNSALDCSIHSGSDARTKHGLYCLHDYTARQTMSP
jgi:hypothetical protein